MIDPLENRLVLVALEMSLFVVFFCYCIITLGSLFFLLPGARERERERERDLIRWLPWGIGVSSVCGRTTGEV